MVTGLWELKKTINSKHKSWKSSQLRVESESESQVAQSYPTLCSPVDCSPPGSSIRGILQARILEWVAACAILIPRPRIELVHSTLETQSLNHWTTREVSGLLNISQCSLLPGTSKDSKSRYKLVPVSSSHKTTFFQQTRHVVTISGYWLASSSVVKYGNFRDLFGELSRFFTRFRPYIWVSGLMPFVVSKELILLLNSSACPCSDPFCLSSKPSTVSSNPLQHSHSSSFIWRILFIILPTFLSRLLCFIFQRENFSDLPWTSCFYFSHFKEKSTHSDSFFPHLFNP